MFGLAFGLTQLLGALSVGSSIVGTVLGVAGQAKQAKASKKAEELRQRQMELEANRRRREAIRQTLVAQAIQQSNAQKALGSGTSSSAMGGQSTGLAVGARNVQGIDQGSQIGQQMFDANAAYSQGRGLSTLGKGVSNFGATLGGSMETFGRLNEYYSNRQPQSQNLTVPKFYGYTS